MDKQPLTASMRQWLLDQVELWREQKLVSEDQANAILDLYETPRESSARHQSIAIYVLLGVAAVFVGLALLLLIGYNWDEIPAAIKLILIIGTVAGTYAAAFYLRFRQQLRIFSEIVFFLGALFYGAAIWLIAQIFHLNAHYPDGFWWWALGVLPIALFLDTFLLHLLLTTLLAIWIGTEIIGFPHLGFWLFGRFPNVPNGCYTLLGFAALGLAWAYQRRSAFTVALYVPLVAWWLVLQPFAMRLQENPIFFIGAVGALMLILAEAHEEGSRFAIPYRLWGSLICMVILAILSFLGIQEEMARFDNALTLFMQTMVVTALAGVAFILAVALHVYRTHGESYLQPAYTLAVRQWLPIAMVVILFVMTVWHASLGIPRNQAFDRRDAVVIVPTVLANLAMLGLAFWLLLVGMREERGFPFAGGVIYFLLWSIMRYFDLFGDFGGMLGASCMFFLCGVALAGFALFWHFWKKQTREARRVQAEEAEPPAITVEPTETRIKE